MSFEKSASILEQANQLPALIVWRFCNKTRPFFPIPEDTFWKIHPDKNGHCNSANGLGQSEGSIRIHSPLRPDM